MFVYGWTTVSGCILRDAKKPIEKMKKVLTKVGGSGILTERLAEGTEDQRELKKVLDKRGSAW